MTKWLAAIALTLVTATGAYAFDPSVEAVTGKYKQGKQLAVGDVVTLMQEAAKWCYDEQDYTCAWADTYFEVDEAEAVFEITNAWDATRNIGYTDRAEFKDGAICQAGYDWVTSVWAKDRETGNIIEGRDLYDLKQEIYANRTTPLDEASDCFDYLYLRADADSEVVTLLQRQYADGVHYPAQDVEVSLHMDSKDAAGLSLRW